MRERPAAAWQQESAQSGNPITTPPALAGSPRRIMLRVWIDVDSLSLPFHLAEFTVFRAQAKAIETVYLQAQRETLHLSVSSAHRLPLIASFPLTPCPTTHQLRQSRPRDLRPSF